MSVQEAAELAFGLLWMVEHHTLKSGDAYEALSKALDKEAKKRGIQAAIDAGHEADHPEGCDWWAGKKE